MVGRGASLNVAVAGSLVLYRLAGMACPETRLAWRAAYAAMPSL